MNKFNYQSLYAPYFNQFIANKRDLGYFSVRIKWVFLELDKFFQSKNIKDLGITREQIEEWRSSRINDAPITLYAKFSLLSQFCKFMCNSGLDCYVPRLPAYPSVNNFTPYIFTSAEILKIFQACDQLELYDKHMSSALFMIPALMRFLYGTGLRISEALALKNKDMDFEKRCLYIRRSKTGSERMVPFSETLARVLKEYVHYRGRMPLTKLDEPNGPFFVNLSGKSCGSNLIYRWFKRALSNCGIAHIGNHMGPRVHDLRHTYATHALVNMARSGLDLYYSLPLLSSCLGHKSIVGTERYVRLTAEIYPDLLNDEKGVSAYLFPSTHKIENNGNN